MTEREKMIDLIINAKKSDPETGSFTEYLADFLLGYGIKLPDPTPQPGKPLTLDQLREMDGQPVWIEDVNRWRFVSIPEAEQFKNTPFVLFRKEDVQFEWQIEDSELTVYSYPPAHIDRSEWTAEWIYDDCEFNLPKCSACGCRSKDATYGHKNNFCPKCGRAMTEEAWAELERRLRG